MINLPSRFQIGDSVRVGRFPGTILGIQFGEGKVRYYVETKVGSVGPLPSEHVEPSTALTVIQGGRS